MKVLIIDTDITGVALACWCVKAGHEVKLMQRKGNSGEEYPAGRGIKGIENVAPSDVFWGRSLLNWADLIVMTSNNFYLSNLEPYRARGYPIFGPSEASTKLEIDRLLGMKVLEEHGIECPPYIEFPNLDKAIAHILANPHGWAFKCNGDEVDKSTSYVSKDPNDLIARLERWKKNGKKFGQVVLQELVEGIEVGVTRWLGPKGWVGPYNLNFEHKKFMNGEKGPNTGEMGTICQYSNKDKLGRKVLDPLKDYLMECGHIGAVDVNCIVDKRGKPWPLEFTMRLGWPCFNIQMATHLGDPVEWMVSLINGGDALRVDYRVACGVLIAQPDFPYCHYGIKKTDGFPIWGIGPDWVDKRFVAPQEMRMGEHPIIKNGRITRETGWCTAGDYLMIVTGLGHSVNAAKTQAYHRVDQIKVPDGMHRTDIGDKVIKWLPQLHTLGYALDMQ